jgi:hypothetical protein
MDGFQETLLIVVDKKIQCLIDDIDERNRGEIRKLWRDITPAPKCVHSSELCKRIQETIGPAYAARTRLVAEAIGTALSEAPHNAISEIREPLMQRVERLLVDPYHQLISSTPGVYERKGAPPGKFLCSSFEHMLALIKVTAINTARRGLRDIDAVIESAALQAQLREMHTSGVRDVSISIVGSTVGTLQTGANSVSIISRSNFPSTHEGEWSGYE